MRTRALTVDFRCWHHDADNLRCKRLHRSGKGDSGESSGAGRERNLVTAERSLNDRRFAADAPVARGITRALRGHLKVDPVLRTGLVFKTGLHFAHEHATRQCPGNCQIQKVSLK